MQSLGVPICHRISPGVHATRSLGWRQPRSAKTSPPLAEPCQLLYAGVPFLRVGKEMPFGLYRIEQCLHADPYPGSQTGELTAGGRGGHAQEMQSGQTSQRVFGFPFNFERMDQRNFAEPKYSSTNGMRNKRMII